jgi:hypothetical protein
MEFQEAGKVLIIGLLNNIYRHMKKSELTHMIKEIVAEEVRKELPQAIAEVFSNFMGNKTVVSEQKPIRSEINEEVENPTIDMKASLRELFAGTNVMKTPSPQAQPRQVKQFTKNPVLNQILNETTPDLRDRERLVGAAAFQGGYSPALAMVPGFNPNAVPSGDVMEEPDFAKHIPVMPGGRPAPLVEGQESSHAPLSSIPNGVSALDVVKHIPAAPEVKKALTRNYSQMMKLIDKKRGKV